jgi:hypothetical protein
MLEATQGPVAGRNGPMQARGEILSHRQDRLGEGEDRESDDEQENTLLRKKPVDENEYAWVKLAATNGSNLSASKEETQRMVLNHSFDMRNAKVSLLSSPHLPNFPESEWTNILAGKCVNLDVVFSGTFATHSEQSVVEQLGELEIRCRGAKPTKTVQTSGDWVSAWTRMARATAFVFLHRANELAAYTDYILGKFSAFRPSFHAHIIEMDKAIHCLVGESNNLDLSDFNAFANIESSFLQPDGTSFSAEQARNRRRKSGGNNHSTKICINFNNRGCN